MAAQTEDFETAGNPISVNELADASDFFQTVDDVLAYYAKEQDKEDD
ncbi:hypothetical protein [Paenibacillus physcomitrellae]|uniref:Uncharacterized protein n=1 Tax=Paenibacillus physcomitrellae TaxID=1619311 RepID=A0ABQ1GAF7_9BACL|nr:hypothetical protein [Paenibacillus physcomitrellae]GGA39923.1 hypothetical protein GCM10010917_26520 [Paenibacillus physcomitrellae]